ncbi:hypothetical protein [Paramagnetospirillum magneticum]|uniref:Uncharacterized protein n=1 Tax=Paramagnetospirillum magneticum (strain ATCC 700264 / AMB-1) TaxID=342108 RepID=Q2W867_PARM1|nr:hypothetical protein [Paramagnetospirillum magneticum]BAE49958.1 hypothetical protein amb1154 [Paramagnetospirillum magneticum AMB-1]
MSDDQLKTLHEHYKDTFALQREREKERDLLFLIVIAVLGVLFLEVGHPVELREALAEPSSTGLKLKVVALPWHAIVSATWAMFLALLLRYSQACVQVERQYPYLHDLEKRLGMLYGDDGTTDMKFTAFSREGDAYTNDYPMVGEWVWLLYVVVFPALAITAIFTLLNIEAGQQDLPIGHFLFDRTVAGTAVATIILYRFVPPIRKAGRKLLACSRPVSRSAEE